MPRKSTTKSGGAVRVKATRPRRESSSALAVAQPAIDVSKAPESMPPYAHQIRIVTVAPGQKCKGPRLLRNFAETNVWVRGIITRRKQKLGQASWSLIRLDKPEDPPNPRVVAKVRDLLKFCNETRESWESLQYKVIEDLLVLDAGCIEKERTLGGDIAGLWQVDGASIEVVSRWPYDGLDKPRYIQWFQNQKIAEWQNEDFIYIMHDPRGYSPIGRSPVETLTEILEAELYGQGYDLAMLKQNAPQGFLDLGPNVTKAQLTEFREYYQMQIAGTKDLAVWGGGDEKVRPNFIPLKQTNGTPDAYNKWMANKIAFAFQCDKTLLGMTDDVNKASSTVTSVRTDEGLMNLAGVLESFYTREIVWEFDDNHAFKFQGLVQRDDISRAKVHQIYLAGKVLTPNEVRAELGLGEVEWGDEPVGAAAASTPGGGPGGSNGDEQPQPGEGEQKNRPFATAGA